MTAPEPAVPPDETDVSQRRARALALSRDGVSLRRIAVQLGVSKDTVARDIAAAERDAVRQPETPPETPVAAAETPPATPGALPGHRLTLDVDEGLYEDLGTLMSGDATAQEAVAYATWVVADAFRTAWARGLYPPGVIPHIDGVTLRPYDSGETPVARQGDTP